MAKKNEDFVEEPVEEVVEELVEKDVSEYVKESEPKAFKFIGKVQPVNAWVYESPLIQAPGKFRLARGNMVHVLNSVGDFYRISVPRSEPVIGFILKEKVVEI